MNEDPQVLPDPEDPPADEHTRPVPVDALEDKDTQDVAKSVGLVAHTDRHPRLT